MALIVDGYPLARALSGAGHGAAFQAADPLSALSDAVKDRLAHETKGGILDELEKLRLRMQAKNQEVLEDVVLDVMDAGTGCCSPPSIPVSLPLAERLPSGAE